MAVHTGAVSNKRIGKRKSVDGQKVSKRRRKQLARLLADQADDEHLYREKQQAVDHTEQPQQGAKKETPIVAPTAAKRQKPKHKGTNLRMGFMALADL